jgi:hypothetical protein
VKRKPSSSKLKLSFARRFGRRWRSVTANLHRLAARQRND